MDVEDSELTTPITLYKRVVELPPLYATIKGVMGLKGKNDDWILLFKFMSSVKPFLNTIRLEETKFIAFYEWLLINSF